MRNRKVIIVGAGIGGLTAALALKARGADVTVLEQADAIREVGAGLQISPNGSVVLQALGLGDALARAGLAARAVVLRDYRRSGDVVRLDLTRHAAEHPYLFVHRADLIELLAQAAREAGAQLRLLQRVDRVSADPGPVLHTGSGARLRADLVVGADGVHSRLRALLNGPEDPFFTGQVAWRATVPNRMNHPPEAQLYMGPKRHVVSYPLRGGDLVNIVAVQERAAWAAEGWHHADDPANLRAAFADFAAPVRGLLAGVEEVGLWGLFRHPVAQSWQGRGVALVGDAAHPTLPFLAQGANMALEDAWVLADALDGAASIEDGLEAYQARRRARACKVIAAANGNAWKYHLRGPIRAPAHMAMRMAGRLAPERMVRQFDWLYAHDVTRNAG